jgi:hypothetical protein
MNRVYIVAAQEGWQVISLDEGSLELYREPVISWLHDVDEDGGLCVEPVTAEGNIWDGRLVVLQRPDGSLFVPHDREIGNFDEAKAYFLKFQREGHKRNEKVNA